MKCDLNLHLGHLHVCQVFGKNNNNIIGRKQTFWIANWNKSLICTICCHIKTKRWKESLKDSTQFMILFLLWTFDLWFYWLPCFKLN